VSEPLPLAIAGAGGRMGRALLELVHGTDEFTLHAALVSPKSRLVGTDAGELAGCGRSGVLLGDDLAAALAGSAVLLDFSTPETTVLLSAACATHGVPLVSGTTGFSAQQRAAIESAAQAVPMCLSANFSTGITLCLDLLRQAARVLAEDADVEIIEAHHRHKVDAPSGTALAMGEAVAHTWGQSLSQLAVYHREGMVGPRSKGSIGFATVRGGDIVGEHTALFATEGERLEISHRAGSRKAFARGALRAARWLVGRPPGIYDMEDVLGLRA